MFDAQFLKLQDYKHFKEYISCVNLRLLQESSLLNGKDFRHLVS